MIKCRVNYQKVGVAIVFEDGKNISLQDDSEICSFGVSCGLIPAPENWDGDPSTLKVDYSEYDLEEIEECPEDYYFDIPDE